ncbi:hypothetical protein EHR01_10375 [Leptospira mtsangambouensis]|uniref:Metal-dependent hydrolase n=1 Tax=Leptospira mtsangambouensis TaxID=2484912 RepID=A0ABY2P039_9LEPT|nr:hypothetical protein [Leptospira mtsangambouensis]TGM74463.1 hypothetical protein EHR01_10375 [Leptospira mtsangambouensis]
MYFGHFAVAVAIKAKEPKVPTLPIFIGVCFLDILNAFFILIGISRVSPNLEALPYLFYNLDYIDWDHSLTMALVWSFLWGASFLKDKKIALIAFLAAFSHFLIDWPMHNSDLALYPNSHLHFGLGLWGKMGIWAWVGEIFFSGILLIYAWQKSTTYRNNLKWQIIFLCLLASQLSPWLSPMKFAATLSEPYAHLMHAYLMFAGFLVPPGIFIWLDSLSKKEKKDPI